MIDKVIFSTFKALQDDSIENNFTIYGNLDEINNTFEAITLHKYTFGLVFSNLGIESQIVELDETSKFLVGFEETIIGMDYITKKEVFRKDTISPFYEFIKTKHYVVAVFELDLYVFDMTLSLLWSTGFRDIIINYTILDGEKVLVKCENGDQVTLALENGQSMQFEI